MIVSIAGVLWSRDMWEWWIAVCTLSRKVQGDRYACRIKSGTHLLVILYRFSGLVLYYAKLVFTLRDTEPS
jgi:hypothetical protein